jgi:hypothetical protein
LSFAHRIANSAMFIPTTLSGEFCILSLWMEFWRIQIWGWGSGKEQDNMGLFFCTLRSF